MLLVRIMKATCEVGALSTLFSVALLTFGIELTLGILLSGRLRSAFFLLPKAD